MRVVIGLDGFVDTILHVVAQRDSATNYTRMSQMRDFAARIGAAAGHSANFEFVTQMVKLGGNGPIMANALGRCGTPVTYIGNLGMPNLHPIFGEFAKSTAVYSIAEPGYTDALEFDDGKLMCGKHESLKEVNWENLTRHLPEPQLRKIFSEASLIALVNWTMLTHMTDIWRELRAKIAPNLEGEKRWLFFDLADPTKRARADIGNALSEIARFQEHFRVILGLNFPESRQIGEVLGLKVPDETYGTITQHASKIQKAIGVETVVIHPTQFAAAADANGATYVVGPFTSKPKITTGAGDHFNAGFCIGRLLNLDLAASLQIGVASSGYYVRHAASPGLQELESFLLALNSASLVIS
jgi:sugar/nucleoside kinase (ribokinase family)